MRQHAEATLETITSEPSYNSCEIPTPANDNNWDGRKIQAWPTGKRLRQAGRDADLYLLIKYRELTDMAFSDPANDNWRDTAPPPGEDDDRPPEEVIVEIDRIQAEGGILPTIEDMQRATTLVDQVGPPDPRKPAKIVRRERGTSVVRRELGGLVFVSRSRLLEYQTEAGGKWKKPTVVHSHHRNKKACDPDLVPNTSGTFSLEDRISARQDLRAVYDKIPASSVRLLELALGSTKAEEIGAAFGKQGKTAERLGVRLIDRAIGHLQEAWCP